MKIVVAIDSSSPSQAVIEEVANRPWPKKTNIRIVNVVESELLGDSLSLIGTEAASVVEMATSAATILVNKAAERVGMHGIQTSAAVIQGHPRIDIVRQAEEWDADLLIVGSHGRTGMTGLLLGSVARTVIRHAPCSVEVVRARTRLDSEGFKILLATDGSPYSVAAAQSVAERPWPRGTEVKVVSVVEVIPLIVDPFYVDPALAQTLIDGQAKQAQDAVSSAEQIVSRAHLNTTSAMPLGTVTGIILDQVQKWGADLLVLGSHGRHGVERLLIGSVSESVAMHAPCSVEVIRKRTERQ